MDNTNSHNRSQVLISFMVIVTMMVVLIWLLSPVLLPLLSASILYMVLEPLVSSLQRRGLGRVPAIAITMLVLLLLTIWLIVVVLPLLSDQFVLAREQLPAAADNFLGLLRVVEHWVVANLGVSMEAGGLLEQLQHVIQTWSAGAIGLVSGWFASLALWLMLVPLITFFLLRDYRSLRNRLIGIAANGVFERVLAIYHRVAEQMQRYLRGVLIQSGVMAAITGTGFAMIGLPTPVMLGLLAGILNLVPYLGPILGMIAPILVAMSIDGGAAMPVAIIMVMVAAQVVDNLFVIPAVIARAADVYPLVALLGVIIAGNFFGLLGMVFVIPALSVTKIIYEGLLVGLDKQQHQTFSS